jgi:hypothetical protein
MSKASEGIAALWAFLTLLLAGFLGTIIRAPSWTGTSSAEAVTPAETGYEFPAPELVRQEHAPRHAPGHAPGSAPDAALPPAYRSYTPRHVPLQPVAGQGTNRPKISGSPPWGPAPRPPDYPGN